MFNEKHCTPSNKSEDISCIPLKLLKKIARSLNKYDSDEGKIKLRCSKDELHKCISDRIKGMSNCRYENCWITINIIKNELLDNEIDLFESSFRPSIPEKWDENPNEWLSTVDINRVMEQYEKAYPNFQYMGANPIDFNKKLRKNKCVSDELCKLNIEDIRKKGKKSIGMVFNTDPHDKSGEHWFAVYIDLYGTNIKKKPHIFHFDSLAKEPKDEIVNFVEDIKKQCGSLNKGKKIDFLFNDIKHQHNNTECGVYCLHFLVSMLQGKDFKKYIKNKRSDEQMEKFRKIFFIPKK